MMQMSTLPLLRCGMTFAHYDPLSGHADWYQGRLRRLRLELRQHVICHRTFRNRKGHAFLDRLSFRERSYRPYLQYQYEEDHPCCKGHHRRLLGL